MSTTTPYLGLTLYDATTDQVVTFATFRAVWGGTAVTSNFYKIDTSASSFNTRISALETNRGAIPVPALFISSNFYQATGISSITAYNTGMTILLSLDTTSDGTVTLDINSLGTKSVMKLNSSGTPVNLTGSDLLDSHLYMFMYDGTRWLWVSQTPEDDGWIADGDTWTYSSTDGSTGIASVNADKTSLLQKGMRFAYKQIQALTAYWTFNTNSNSDVGSFNGTDTSMTYTAGQFSNAATFNGTTSKIIFSDSASLKPTGEFTIGLWFKTSNTGAIKNLFQSYSANTSVAGIQININASNVISVTIGKNTGTTLGTDYSLLTGTTTVTDNVFHYLVLSFRNNYVQIYLDGNLETSGYSYTPAYAGTNYVRCGVTNSTGTDANFMNGQIDDLFLINGYALDEKTIRDKYLANTAQGTGNITVQKMSIITNVGAYSGGNTNITFWGGTDYSLVNATISSPKYSNEKVPFGFPTNPTKWSILYTNIVQQSQATPSANTWYNLGGASISIPIGVWNMSYNASTQGVFNLASVSSCGVRATLSTGTSSASDGEFTGDLLVYLPIDASAALRGDLTKSKILSLSTKTTYYLNALINNAVCTSVSFRGDLLTTRIYGVLVYL